MDTNHWFEVHSTQKQKVKKNLACPYFESHVPAAPLQMAGSGLAQLGREEM